MIRRTIAIAMLVAAGGTLTASAQSVTTEGASVARPAADAAVALMDKRVERVDWVDKPFEEILDWLRDESEGQVNVIPRWGALSVESVDADSLVTLQLNNATIGEVFTEVINQLSEDGVLGFMAYGNTLKLSTRADFNRKMYVRVYDATDLLFLIEDFGQEAPAIDMTQTNRQGGGGGGGGGSSQGVFGGGGGGGQGQQTGGEEAEQDRRERLEALRDMIMTTVAPETWNTIGTSVATGGGPAAVPGQGRISIYNTSLIVLNTIEVHEQLAGLFSFSD